MAGKRKTDRTDVVKRLQTRGPYTPDEKPYVAITAPMSDAEASAFFARHAAAPRLPHSPEQFHEATLNAYLTTVGSAAPPEFQQLLSELSFKMRAAEHHLRAVTSAAHGEPAWFEAEAFFNQTRSALEMMARLLHSVLPVVADSFDGDGKAIANQLRNQTRTSNQYESSLKLANLIDDEEPFISSLSAVRSTIFHRCSLPSLALVKIGTGAHLGGLTLQEFCIQHILFFRAFLKPFLEFTIAIEAALADPVARPHAVEVRLVASAFPRR